VGAPKHGAAHRLFIENGAVQKLCNLGVDFAPAHVAVLRHRHFRVAQLVRTDPRRQASISEGFEQGLSGEQLAEAAGLSVPRVYQIRDGRRQ
jgi:hypothetical protein